jgi:hypothetical protein
MRNSKLDTAANKRAPMATMLQGSGLHWSSGEALGYASSARRLGTGSSSLLT